MLNFLGFLVLEFGEFNFMEYNIINEIEGNVLE